MFGRFIWTALLAAAGYLAWRFFRSDEQPPTTYQPTYTPPVTPQPTYTPPVTPPASTTPANTPVVTESVPVEVAAPATEIPPVVTGEEGDVIEAYCASCRQRRTISGAHPVTASNGRAGMRGTCTSCGASVFTFVKKK